MIFQRGQSYVVLRRKRLYFKRRMAGLQFVNQSQRDFGKAIGNIHLFYCIGPGLFAGIGCHCLMLLFVLRHISRVYQPGTIQFKNIQIFAPRQYSQRPPIPFPFYYNTIQIFAPCQYSQRPPIHAARMAATTSDIFGAKRILLLLHFETNRVLRYPFFPSPNTIYEREQL